MVLNKDGGIEFENPRTFQQMCILFSGFADYADKRRLNLEITLTTGTTRREVIRAASQTPPEKPVRRIEAPLIVSIREFSRPGEFVGSPVNHTGEVSKGGEGRLYEGLSVPYHPVSRVQIRENPITSRLSEYIEEHGY